VTVGSDGEVIVHLGASGLIGTGLIGTNGASGLIGTNGAIGAHAIGAHSLGASALGSDIATGANGANAIGQLADGMRRFELDRSFGAGATQESVFDEVRPLVQSALDGFDVCVFAHGASGSGKTYTMIGPPKQRGIAYRALASLMDLVLVFESELELQVEATMVEIYNGQVRDLAAEAEGEGAVVGAGEQPLTLRVRELDDVMNLMTIAGCFRTVGRTLLNERSSRAHTVLSVSIRATNRLSGEETVGSLRLVDLAGSELARPVVAADSELEPAGTADSHLLQAASPGSQVQQSAATGSAEENELRRMEGEHIHESLGALANVLRALLHVRTAPTAHSTRHSHCSTLIVRANCPLPTLTPAARATSPSTRI